MATDWLAAAQEEILALEAENAKILTMMATKIAELKAENAKLREQIAPAMHLASGSFGTAKDLGVLLLPTQPALAEELKRLAKNFKRIEELLRRSGDDGE